MRGFTAGRVALAIALGLYAAQVLADKVILKDGTEVDGTVIVSGDRYWVKSPDGSSRMFDKEDVERIERPGSGGTSGSSIGRGGLSSPGGSGPAVPSSAAFRVTKQKADQVETPLAAVTLWQNFIDTNEGAPELEEAKKELAHWQELADGGAERIKGRWVGGEERKAILAQAERLSREGAELLRRDQTLQAIAKLTEANRIYPNSFRTAYLLGFISLVKDDGKTAIGYFEQALRINPNSAEAMANIGIIHCMDRKVEKGITYLIKAANMRDSIVIANNLVLAVHLNPSIARSSRHKQTMQTVNLLASKYNIPLHRPPRSFLVVPIPPEAEAASEGDMIAGMSSGTGFLISADGLIVTNAHVVAGGKAYMVIVAPGDQRTAELVAMDEEQDLAVLRVKARKGEKLPHLAFTATDKPSDGAEVTVMGYPMIDRLGRAVKITRGIVSSSSNPGIADVLVDAKINPGNSGGPMLDRHGNVMAVVCMKSYASATEESYGMGISSGTARAFLAKHGITTPTGDADAPPLSTEEIAAKAKPATVCILATH